jgi:hypothetical protein
VTRDRYTRLVLAANAALLLGSVAMLALLAGTVVTLGGGL